MRVVDVTQWYSPVSGGIRTYLRAKAAWAERAGMAHAAVVTGPAAGSDLVAASPFVRVRGRTPADRWGYRLVPRPAPVIEALERLRPGVLVLHDALAFPRALARWARERGIPVAMVCHSDLRLAAAGLPGPLPGAARAVLDRVQRRALSAPQLVLVASAATRERVAGEGVAPVVVAPLGVDLDDFGAARPDAALRASLADPEEALLLYAGRLSSEKRVMLLPDMMVRMRVPVRLAVAGVGAAEAGMRRRARRLGVEDRIVFLGHLGDRGALARLMASADCFVHPNPDEPFGLAPLEALAAGCRVVAPSAPGPREVLARRGALLVAPGDPAALANGVRRALALPRPRLDLDDLSWDRVFDREWRLYRGLGAAA
ncbi:MAG: glycosyltransferase [Thermoleophilia bacterium]